MSIQLRSTSGLSLGVCKGALIGLSSIALTATAIAQSPAPTSSPILSQAIQAFSADKPISSIDLVGTATVHQGGPPDEGSVTLTADTKGKTELKLNLRTSGESVESQDSTTPMMTCIWQKSDGIEHKTRGRHCQTPLVWFLPMMTLQAPNVLSQGLTVSDLGTNSGDNPRRTLAIQFSSSTVDASVASTTTVRSSAKPVKLELEPNSLLPLSYRYSLPASNSIAIIAFETRFSDYRRIGDTQLPFLIQRYVNGALQLEIRVSEARITN
ncbi:MAG: hypothetical protein JSS95_13560 [Acidobacteria bacterium]|nr:hypothetical protein [Acidobacteriota bacterium]